MNRTTGCNRVDHMVSRRGLMAGSAGIALSGSITPAHAVQLAGEQKQILQIFLQGGVSQLESWDPKPGTRYGGPFRAIPTTVPGVHISELLPMTAKRMHLLSIVRSIDIKTNSHHLGRLFMEMGRRSGTFPYVGAVASKYLAPRSSPLPGYVHISTRGLTDISDGFLGARHGQLMLSGESAPENLTRPETVTSAAARRRDELRKHFNQRFAGRTGQRAFTEILNSSFDTADKLMNRRKLLVAEPTPKDLERYGKHDFAQKCILARTLLEQGATCVKVTHHGYDTHAENFNFHLEQLGEFEPPFCALLDDLHYSGMLEHTLVMIYSEFGRTPVINQRYGRDHWGTAWSIALGGCGINAGMVVGSTNAEGTEVAEREVHGGHLFHTYFRALGLDTSATHDITGRDIPIGDPAAAPVEELLA